MNDTRATAPGRNIATGSRYYNEDGKLVHLSGNTYVPVRLRGEREKWSPLIIRKPARCEDHTVCLWCVESWMWDYDFRFEATKGGRALKALAEANSVDLESYVRWNSLTETDADRERSKEHNRLCGRILQPELNRPAAG